MRNPQRTAHLAMLMTATTLLACTPSTRDDAVVRSVEPPEAHTIARHLIGTFSSAAQATSDDRYFSIRIVTIPIWPERWGDGAWVYIEQAAQSSLERPYRQRVYHIQAMDGGFTSEVYALPGDPLRFVGSWNQLELFATIGPEDLPLRDGCTVHLQQTELGYEGSTRGNGCSSTLAGASYATSEVVLLPNRLESWDRGFDANGDQVWGAEAGAYVFDRVADAP